MFLTFTRRWRSSFSIIWKQINGGMFVKAIEWDVDDGFSIPNPRFQGITTLDEKTGQITITNLKVEHSGLYTIDINNREQLQRFSLTVTGEDVKKAVGGTVSFHPDKLESSVTSFTWKQIKGGMVVKAIEWDDDDGVSIPNPRFKGITTLDEKTGQITITNLKVEHSGLYSIYINSREQEHRFSLTVMEPVPKPVITLEKSSNPDVVYLRCGYNETIIWKNSAGDTLKGKKNHNPGEFITVTNTRNPENLYTCTLKNAVSEETSDRVYERDIFVTGSFGPLDCLLKKIDLFGLLDCLIKKKEGEPKDSPLKVVDSELLKMTASTSDEEPQ